MFALLKTKLQCCRFEWKDQRLEGSMPEIDRHAWHGRRSRDVQVNSVRTG